MTQNCNSTRQVVTIDDHGNPAGSMGLRQAHELPGTLHRAVSVQLVDRSGRWLVQRRASTKPLFADRWANTCCTHPLPGERFDTCARRRVFEELGITVGALTPAGRFTYRAVDPVSGLVEHELDHVFVGKVDDGDVVRPDPGEVAEVTLLDLSDAVQLFAGASAAPWAATVLELGRGAYRRAMEDLPAVGRAS